MRDGVNFDPIKVDGDNIVDGIHRYIASQIEGVPLDVVQWTKAPSAKPISWSEMVVDAVDY
ncbi:MAG: hypothetical protein IPK13_12415 [Deltaproteobacteria bacterium]|nr:hypothetical protein [Deltaproteobacteria bacterium]